MVSYKVINYGKLDSDVKNINKKLKAVDGYTITERLSRGGTHSAIIRQSSYNAAKFSKDYKLDLYKLAEPGLMKMGDLMLVCKLFELNYEDYLAKMTEDKEINSEETPVVESKNDEEILITLQEIASQLRKIDDVLRQNSEYNKECMNYLATMNAKYNKPKAYIPYNK